MPELPKLSPITSVWMEELMGNPFLISELIEKYGSPINIHQPDAMDENFLSYQKVFKDFGLKHKIFFARKANKTKGMVRKANSIGMGIDTASLQEYQQCIEMGIAPSDLIVTAAVKNKKLVEIAVKHGSLIILDNRDECELVQRIALDQNKSAEIAFRISGFRSKDQKLYSRFGFDVDEIEDFISSNMLDSDHFSRLNYKGLHFHLNGYSIQERGSALTQCLALAEKLLTNGLKTDFIDIGGGFLMNYLKKELEWDYFNQQLRLAVGNKRDEITFENQGLGLHISSGVLLGQLKTYPFWSPVSKGEFLRGILSFQSQSGEKAGTLAKDMGIEIRMEPGRSMLDQVGLTIAKVAFRKKDHKGNWLVGLEMNMTQMLSGSADFLLDPYVIYQEKETKVEPVEVYFTGAYCLERDILLKRKIALVQLPAVGDFVVFVNTAGYMMHFFESNAHLFPLATNLIWNRNTAIGTFQASHFQNDEDL